MSRAVMQQALEAINAIPEDVEGYLPESLTDAVVALRAALAEPEQEPVLYINPKVINPATGKVRTRTGALTFSDEPCAGWSLPLYTEPTLRRPLPASEIVTMYAENPSSDAEMIEFARAIERAHGIGEQT